MLNKELLMGVSSKETGVILLVEEGHFTSLQTHYGYMERPALGLLNKVPYWKINNLTLLCFISIIVVILHKKKIP